MKKAKKKDDEIWDMFLTIAYTFSWFKDSFGEDRIFGMTKNYFVVPSVKRLLPKNLQVEEHALRCGCQNCYEMIVEHFQRIGDDPNVQARTQNEIPLRMIDFQDWERLFKMVNS